jgi:hypothetical protein
MAASFERPSFLMLTEFTKFGALMHGQFEVQNAAIFSGFIEFIQFEIEKSIAADTLRHSSMTGGQPNGILTDKP